MDTYTIFLILLIASVSSALIPIWYSFLNYKAFNKQLKALFIYLIISILMEVVIITLNAFKYPVFQLQFSFAVFEFLLFTYLYWLEFRKKSYRIVIVFLCSIYVIGIIIPFFQHKNIDFIQDIIDIIEAITIILLSIIFFFKTIIDLEIPKLTNYPFFWLNSAFLLYFGANFFIILFNNTMKEFDQAIVYFLTSIHHIINITYNVLIAIGCLVMFILVIVIIMFVVIYQRKMLLKEAKIQLMEQDKQITLFKASVEAEEQQKEKIARNLHDEINPILTLLKFNLSKHRIEIKKNKFEADSLIVDAQLLDQAIEGIRTTCLELIPTYLLQYGLLKSLEDHMRNLQQVGSITTEFENHTESIDIEVFEKQAQLNIYRICLEILNNLVKHSNASTLKLTITRLAQFLILEFNHNGSSVTNEEMNAFTENSSGLGLKSLKARALILNAKIEYSKFVNQASVKLSIPI